MRTIRYLVITALLIMLVSTCAYAGSEDKSDKLSSNQSTTFSPGYINSVMQKARSISDQAHYSNAPMQNIENTDNMADVKLDRKVDEAAVTKVTPELKKKTGGSENTKAPETSSANVITPDATGQRINIGTGTDQMIEGGRLISEVIDGKRYIYAGFTNAGTASISDAMSRAVSGDTIIVKSGEYGAGDMDFELRAGVSICGGYNDDGSRDTSGGGTIINSEMTIQFGSLIWNEDHTWATFDNSAAASEISGFTFAGGFRINDAVNLTLKNNVFGSYFKAYFPSGPGSITIERNTFDNTLANLEGMGASALFTNNNFSGLRSGISTYDVAVNSAGNNYLGNSTAIQTYFTTVTSTGDYFDTGISQQYEVVADGTVSIADSNYAPNSWADPVTADPAPDLPVATVTTALSSPYMDDLNQLIENRDEGLNSDYLSGSMFNPNLTESMNVSSLKDMLGVGGGMNMMLAGQNAADTLRAYALSVPAVNISAARGGDMQLALALAGILKNPTEDQKLILDAMISLLRDVNKDQGETAQSPELKKAEDDLLQVVANILIAQAIPDLLKEGDMTIIKVIFDDLNTQKNKLISEYNLSIDPYYREVKRLISKNLAMLQLSNVVSKTMVAEQLDKLEPNEVDRLLEKLRKISNRSAEQELILEQESSLKAKYVDPSKKVFEGKMKGMLESFTARLSKILEAKKK